MRRLRIGVSRNSMCSSVKEKPVVTMERSQVQTTSLLTTFSTLAFARLPWPTSFLEIEDGNVRYDDYDTYIRIYIMICI